MWDTAVIVLALLCCNCGTAPTDGTTDAGNIKPEIYSLRVESDIRFRYARTVISSRIANPSNESQEVSFSAVLPETAFISEFLLARDSNRFTVSVNVEPKKKVTFNLTYEELLSRKLGTYKHVINLDPGQIVRDLSVEVRINESADITTLNVPALRTSNEIDADSSTGATNPLVTTEHPTPHSAVVRFVPTADQQRELASDGIKGQLVVEYDVSRTENPTQVLINDGYFVHFFSPDDLKPLRKQVTFVLDVSGSMSGRKIEQLREAMTIILGDLNEGDLFSIILFSAAAEVWDIALNETDMNKKMQHLLLDYGENADNKLTPSVIAMATSDNIEKAKKFVAQLEVYGGTNIYDGLKKALDVAELGRSTWPGRKAADEQRPEPIIIFLTDGQPNTGVSDPDTIVSRVTDSNAGVSSIFSLALGSDADFGFLKKLSLRNTGFARKIYEASDTALQLRDFYRQVSSPLLANVTFKYNEGQVEENSLTTQSFRRLFFGSELVVAGHLLKDDVKGQVSGWSSSGDTSFPISPIIVSLPSPPTTDEGNKTASSMERLWAYLTIQQLLEKDASKDYDRSDKNQTSPEKERALQLALKYSFVTPLTSLVVVKPNETKSVDAEDASESNRKQFFLPSAVSGFGSPGAAGVPLIVGGLAPVPPGAPVAAAASPFFPPSLSEDAVVHTEGGNFMEPAQLANLTDVKWLAGLLNDSSVSLPVGMNGTTEVLQLAAANETNVAHGSCTTPPSEPGYCRHFKHCILDRFTNSLEDYLPYFCRINSFAGVCCPDYLE
ncbi:inter-alpha-trypsin inhibitor heavy chain H4-like isoform X2 [Periplaneta americana]|uniref:inter-alpha-trypsin inhibitor heavy chain H4-like isoform X2 n=1 Tax=Periplaneta americana TaxID=6978 RepID=UPI0037E953EE